MMESVTFNSGSNVLTGHVYLPEGYDPQLRYPAVVCSGSWTTVKEQMAGLYAKRLAEKGYLCLAFDFTGFGESEGEPRFYEHPEQKIKDIHHAISYLLTRKDVEQEAIATLGICAGSMYTLMEASQDERVKAVATVASWLHDAEAVKLFYGGEDGVKSRIEAAQQAKKHYAQTNEVLYIPTISKTDSTAAMYGDYDYYLNPSRGAVPNWSADKFAVMSWEDWLALDPMPSASNLNTPTLMVHSDGCVLPQYTKNYFEKIPVADKKLHWVETDLPSPVHQFMFYDQNAEVSMAVELVEQWFGLHLRT
ncbi:alpha/beta hydrolase [Vibrio alfacsensis]|uniref:alpha/beta hydrolase n=1 Tax=Vibrio alfacsensis TaxID=1074311 RepID=UPI0040676307